MKRCFVLMPFDNALRPVYETVQLGVSTGLGKGWECERADDRRRPGMVTEKVIRSIVNSDLVIAILTDLRASNGTNPNVMYELGIAHSFRKPSIVVSDNLDGLPFDLRDLEAIPLDVAALQQEHTRSAILTELRNDLIDALRCYRDATPLDRRSLGRNPVTIHLADTFIFVEDLPWLHGYCDVFKRESEASTIWEITRDLFWPTEPLFFEETIRKGIINGKKRYLMIPHDPGVVQKVGTVKNQLLKAGLSEEEIDAQLHFVTLEPSHFDLWPLSIVLYDADLATKRSGVICEPMESEVGKDGIDHEILARFEMHRKSEETRSFQECLDDLEWTDLRRESTFDIRLDGRVVDKLASAFTEIWNRAIDDEAKALTNEDAKSQLRANWLIRR